MAEYISFQPSDYYSTKLYTGNQPADNAITGVGFSPNFVWVKNRDATKDHTLFNTVQGVGKSLYANTNGGEVSDAAGMKSFDADGFTVGDWSQPNTNGDDYVSWNWKESTTSKCDIVQYSGTGSAQTIAHNLGVKPDLIIIKRTDTTSNWIVYHQSLGATKFMYLNTTDDEETNSGVFNNTEPTSSVFTVNTWNDVNNSSGTYIAYVFAGMKGYSKFGSYTGAGSTDGTFIYTGFRPAYFLIKANYSGEPWLVWNNKTEGFNAAAAASTGNHRLTTSSTAAESDSSDIDICSNGIKIRSADGHVGAATYEYIYAAFAEFPIVSSNDVPGVAR